MSIQTRMLSPILQEIKNLFVGDENVNWMQLLYSPSASIIDIWYYFDRDYDDIPQRDLEEVKMQLLEAYRMNDTEGFLSLLRLLPEELIDNGIAQTISGFERERDEINLTNVELNGLGTELTNLHNAVLNGKIDLSAHVDG